MFGFQEFYWTYISGTLNPDFPYKAWYTIPLQSGGGDIVWTPYVWNDVGVPLLIFETYMSIVYNGQGSP